MMDRLRLRWVLAAALACSFLFADHADAADHLMHVNEVMLSTGGDGTAQFIELFDPAAEGFPGEPYTLEIFDAGGTSLGSVNLGDPSGTAPISILVSTAAADTALGTGGGDFVLTVALPTDGQACFVNATGTPRHCVAWGCVTAPIARAERAPSPPDGMSIQRQARGGAWQLATPTPDAANTAGTTEVDCPSAAVDAGPGGTDAGPGGTDAGPGGTDAGPGGTDAGPMGSDAGGSTGSDAGTTEDGGGCSVSRSRSAPLALLLLLGALVLWRRRRRRR